MSPSTRSERENRPRNWSENIRENTNVNRPMVVVFIAYCFSFSYILIPGSVLLSRLKLVPGKLFSFPQFTTLWAFWFLSETVDLCGYREVFRWVHLHTPALYSAEFGICVLPNIHWILSIFRQRLGPDFVTRHIVFCASKAITSFSVTNKWIPNI